MTGLFVSLAGSARIMWIISAFLWSVRLRPPVVSWVLNEFRPLILPLIFVQYFAPVIFDGHIFNPGDIFQIGIAVANWAVMRNAGKDDDDRWKRRKAKAAEKVANVGGRLTVVSVGAE